MQQELTAGDSLNYTTTIVTYPPSGGWTAKLRLNPRAGGAVVTVTAAASADNTSYLWQVGPVTTAAWAAGEYGWAITVEKAGERYTVEQGQIKVLPDPATVAGGTDTRTQAEKALADAQTALAGWSVTTKRYNIAGREMEFNSTSEIIQVISYWTLEVKRERNAAALAAGMKSRRQVHVRLGRA